MPQLVQNKVVDWIPCPRSLAHLGWIVLDGFLVGPSPFGYRRGILGRRQRADPGFDALDFGSRQLASHRHPWRKLALDELHERTLLRMPGDDGPAMFIASLNHQIERGHGKSAGTQLARMASGAVLLQQVFDGGRRPRWKKQKESGAGQDGVQRTIHN